MELICISDTHGNHQELDIPSGDILIHAGDITEGGTKREVLSFLHWFSEQPHRHKIFIAGNHDFYLENLSEKTLKEIIPKNVFYLNENGIKINGISIWGSPFVPNDGNWAFSEDSDNKLRERWNKIPTNLDILITHSPPYGIMDQSDERLLLGCKILRKKIAEIKPKFHIFGHLHDNYGLVKNKKTVFVNATSFNTHGKLVNPPIKIFI